MAKGFFSYPTKHASKLIQIDQSKGVALCQSAGTSYIKAWVIT